MQKSLIVNGYWDKKGTWTDTTDQLNKYFTEGYEIVNVSPMGAFGFGFGYANSTSDSFSQHDSQSDHGFASLVIIEKK
ncbi:hypothetical protein [Jeotgalibacillus sp. JSM ZJ347]|uniref:hypothetical protein n=1 Tax=Jeotgalibacillus sp. JSM ZJ347 TaxID=3342117 RepID=UPI0035A95BE0